MPKFKLIIMTAILMGLSVPAMADSQIEIKGFKTGMEWENPINSIKHLEKDPLFEHRRIDLTVAGYDVLAIQLRPDLARQRVASIYFTLDSDAYDSVKRAIMTKYRLKCDNSTEQNLAGAKFKNEECSYSSNGDTMYIERYAGDLRKMSILIFNDKDTDETFKAKQAKKDSDI